MYEYRRKNELKYLVHVTGSDMNIGEYWRKNELKSLVLALGFKKKISMNIVEKKRLCFMEYFPIIK